MGVKYQFFSLGKFKLGDGSQIRLWEETWLDRHPLKMEYPNLFNIVLAKSMLRLHTLSTVQLNASFRRALLGNKLLEWNNLVARVANIFI